MTETKLPIEVRGVVTNGPDGVPVEGVQVTLIRRLPPGQDINVRTITDARGSFVLPAPTPGDYSITAFKPPMSFGEYGKDPFEGPQKWFTVSGPTTGIVVRLWDSPRLAGSVVDENSQPLSGTVVRAMQVRTLGGRPVLRTVATAHSAASGRYSLQVTLPGAYLIAAFPPISAAAPARRMVFYPGVSNPNAASILELAKGQSTQGLDFHLRREEGWTIAGTVTLPDDLPRSSSLELFDVASDGLCCDNPVARTSFSRTGAFTFPRVPASSYEIRFAQYPQFPASAIRDGAASYNQHRALPGRIAHIPEGPTWWTAARVQLIDGDVLVGLRPETGVRLSGRVVFEGPAVKPDSAALPTRAVYLRSLDYRFFSPSLVTAPREDGRFQTVQVPPGPYVLGMIDQYDGFQLQSVRINGREGAGIAFELNQDTNDVVLTFSSLPTAVTGRIAGEPGEKQFVLIWPEDESLWTGSGTELGRIRQVVAYGGGYRATVFPGTYRVIAANWPPPRDWESPSVLRSLLPVSERVTVPAGETVVLNLTPRTRRWP